MPELEAVPVKRKRTRTKKAPIKTPAPRPASTPCDEFDKCEDWMIGQPDGGAK
jgi:hypothetical protein